MEYYVYKHIRLKDGSTFYIGKGKGDRFKSEQHRNTHWNRIVKKDGGFTAEIVKDGLTESESFDLEIKLIQEMGLENLSNITEGGYGGNTYTEETKKRVSEMMTGRFVSDETRNKLSQSLMGHESYWKGKERPNHSKKIKEKHKSGIYTYEWLSEPKSDEHKKKLSESARKRKRMMVKCDKCGMEVPNTHLAVHQRGKKCII